MKYRSAQLPKGMSLIETVVGAILFILLILFFIDVGTVVACQTNNDRMAKNAARAAADKDNAVDGRKAADLVISKTLSSSFFSDPQIKDFTFDTTVGQVTVETAAMCHLPIPIPFASSSDFELKARASETIVGILAE